MTLHTRGKRERESQNKVICGRLLFKCNILSITFHDVVQQQSSGPGGASVSLRICQLGNGWVGVYCRGSD